MVYLRHVSHVVVVVVGRVAGFVCVANGVDDAGDGGPCALATPFIDAACAHARSVPVALRACAHDFAGPRAPFRYRQIEMAG